MLACILLGAAMTGATVAIHGVGTAVLVTYLYDAKWLDKLHFRLREAVGLLSMTAIFLLFLHIAEVMIWAICFSVLKIEDLATFEDCMYFSAVTFTSLGYGDLVISGQWRLLGGFQAMNGLLIFGWSTAILLAAVQRLWLLEDAWMLRNSRTPKEMPDEDPPQ